MRSLIASVFLCCASICLAAPRVSLELATEKGFPITGAQEWSKLLADLDVTNFRIRSATGADQPSIEELGDNKNPSYRIVGILTAKNMLVVPGGQFSSRDAGGLRTWLEKLSDQGEAGVTERRRAFGLLGKQLSEVHDDLKQPIDFTTRDVMLAEVVEKLKRRLNLPIVIDTASNQALQEVKLVDELRGVSSGTALAIMLRSAGLAFVPERPTGGDLQYHVGKPKDGGEVWPLGWPSQKRPFELVPDLYEFINVEISDTPAQEAIDAIAERLGIPFVYDRNAMALHQIDLAKVSASVPSKRSTYSLILQKVLSQAKMKQELRLDDADKPFLWITTVKPVGK
jgi:hypothetical protein